MRFARLVSFVFHPATFFFIMTYLIVYKQTDSGIVALKWQVFSSAFIFIGIVIILVGRWRGIFSDHDLSKKEERAKFYGFLWPLAFSYLTAALILRGLFFFLSIIAFGIVLGMFIFHIVSRYIKASIHLAISCGFVLTLGFLYGETGLLATIWIPPLLAWSRLKLTKHTKQEVIAGGLLGICITFLTFLIGKYVFVYTR
ncbi:MAG: hypothetical protein AAB840_00535 [Patescibacteria group bacterium]